MGKGLTYWERWQLENHGNVLPEGPATEEFESGEQVMRDQLVWFENEEQVWLEERSF
jgi:hypothetical protein